jgi:hypothetical protein
VQGKNVRVLPTHDQGGDGMRWNRGQVVVFPKQKYSPAPGPRAREVDAAPGGETYSYLVDKFWIVKETLADGRLVVLTRGGKEHVLRHDDLSIRGLSLLERLRHRQRLQDLLSVLKKAG